MCVEFDVKLPAQISSRSPPRVIWDQISSRIAHRRLSQRATHVAFLSPSTKTTILILGDEWRWPGAGGNTAMISWVYLCGALSVTDIYACARECGIHPGFSFFHHHAATHYRMETMKHCNPRLSGKCFEALLGKGHYSFIIINISDEYSWWLSGSYDVINDWAQHVACCSTPPPSFHLTARVFPGPCFHLAS